LRTSSCGRLFLIKAPAEPASFVRLSDVTDIGDGQVVLLMTTSLAPWVGIGVATLWGRSRGRSTGRHVKGKVNVNGRPSGNSENRGIPTGPETPQTHITVFQAPSD
jgi:hypothetical protein